jgi:uncharacterized protein YjbI with pentapeptide repeats
MLSTAYAHLGKLGGARVLTRAVLMGAMLTGAMLTGSLGSGLLQLVEK